MGLFKYHFSPNKHLFTSIMRLLKLNVYISIACRLLTERNEYMKREKKEK